MTVSTGTGDGDCDCDCDGLARFDSEAWTRYLRGRCIFAIDIAPDGTAWLQAARMAPNDGEQWLPLEPIQTYAIRPATGSKVVNPGGRIPEQAEVTPAIGAMESGEGFGGVHHVPERRDLPVFLVTGDRDEAVEKTKRTLGDDATFEVRVVERSMEELLSIGDYGDDIHAVKQGVAQLDRAGGLPERRPSWPLFRRTGIPYRSRMRSMTPLSEGALPRQTSQAP